MAQSSLQAKGLESAVGISKDHLLNIGVPFL